MPNVTCITLSARSLPKALKFYQALGFKPGYVSKEVLFFQLNGSVLSVYREDLFKADLKLKRLGAEGTTLAVNVASKKAVDAFYAKALKAGAKAIRAPHEAAWGGYTCYFSGPDKHAWEVAWNPFWKLDKKGDVKL